MKLLILPICLLILSISHVTATGIAHIYSPRGKDHRVVQIPGDGVTTLVLKNEKHRRIDTIKFEDGESADITINPNGAVSVIYQPVREQREDF